jgi:hypothetical protein
MGGKTAAARRPATAGAMLWFPEFSVGDWSADKWGVICDTTSNPTIAA